MQITSPPHLQIIWATSDLEWYKGSGVWKTWGGLGWASGLADPRLLHVKLSEGGGSYPGIHKRGAMLARYKLWALLIISSSIKLRCLVFHIIVLKKPNVCPVPMNIYIYILESYGLDSISCTGFVRVMGYKSLLLATNDVIDLLVWRRGLGEGANKMIVIIIGPIPTRGRGVWT